MNAIFTVCSNNYLAKARVLNISARKHAPDCHFFIFLCDKKTDRIDYSSLADEIIEIFDIEPGVLQLAAKYNIVELNTSVKPRIFEYLLNERNFDKVIYLDPDIKLYNSLSQVFDELTSFAIVLTPHICSPIPLDGKKPGENMFNNFGTYNLGFLGLSAKPEALRFCGWWKAHTYKQCYVDVYNGIFVDQLPINHVPVFFNAVKVDTNKGLNMAPWNLHERELNFVDESYVVNHSQPLIFFHFSSINPNELELPLKLYDRFTLSDRPDLRPIYDKYSEELKIADDDFYKTIPFYYSAERDAYLLRTKKNKWNKRFKKIFGRN